MLVNWDMNDNELVEWLEGLLHECGHCCLDEEEEVQEVALKIAANLIQALRMRSAHPSDPVGETL